MKSIIILVFIVSCGYAKNKDLKKANHRLDHVELELKNLKQDFSLLYDEIKNAAEEKNQLTLELAAINSNQELTETELENAVNQINQTILNLSAETNVIQSSLDTVQLKVTELELQERVVQLVDPCPNPAYTDYAEVFMLTSSGKYVAYFESGATRHLTVLRQNTNYMTTDSRACHFFVNSQNQIVLN